jgi:hypothetical protein
MGAFPKFLGGDATGAAMFFAAGAFMLESIVLALLLYLKKRRDKKLFRKVTAELEYRISEIASIFAAGLALGLLGLLRIRYFGSMDTVLGAFPALFAVALANIALKVGSLFLSEAKAVATLVRSAALKCADDMAMAVIIAATSAILASEMPVAGISKFFGAGTTRAQLINLPFVLATVFLAVSNAALLAQNFLKRLNPARSQYINEIVEMSVFAASAGITVACQNFGLNVFLVLMVGLTASCVISGASYYFNGFRLGRNKKLPASLFRLYTISNVLSSTFVNILMTSAVIFASLNFGGFYGMSIATMGMTASTFLNSNLSILYGKSMAQQYVAKTINNVVLFYIFFETLQFILKRQVAISIFSNNVVIGLFLSVALAVFNILKVVNLARYIEARGARGYILFRSLVYVALFAAALWFAFPFINHEILAAFALGTVIMASFISLVLLNGADVFDMISEKVEGGSEMLRGAVVPLSSQIATLLIIMAIMLLPMVK